MTCARGLTALPAAQTPGTLVRPVPSVMTQPVSEVAQPSSVSRVSFGSKLAADEHRSPSHDLAGHELDPGQAVVLDGEAGDGIVVDADVAARDAAAVPGKRCRCGQGHQSSDH